MHYALIKTDVLIVMTEPESYALKIFRPYGAPELRGDPDRALPCL